MENVDLISGVVLPYVNFVIFAVLAFVFLRKPLNAMALQRHDSYKVDLEEARRAQKEAEEKLAQVTAQMADIQTELSTIRDRTRSQARTEAADMIAEAQQLATHLKEEAQKVAVAEVELARVQLRRDIAAQVRGEIEAALKSGIQPEIRKKLHESRVREISQMKMEVSS